MVLKIRKTNFHCQLGFQEIKGVMLGPLLSIRQWKSSANPSPTRSRIRCSKCFNCQVGRMAGRFSTLFKDLGHRAGTGMSWVYTVHMIHPPLSPEVFLADNARIMVAKSKESNAMRNFHGFPRSTSGKSMLNQACPLQELKPSDFMGVDFGEAFGDAFGDAFGVALGVALGVAVRGVAGARAFRLGASGLAVPQPFLASLGWHFGFEWQGFLDSRHWRPQWKTGWQTAIYPV